MSGGTSLAFLSLLFWSRLHITNSGDIDMSDEKKEIMKKELSYVVMETNQKVAKLNQATDIQIGEWRFCWLFLILL